MLELPRTTVLGMLEFMWMTCHDSNDPVFESAELVEAAADWSGEAGVWAEALLHCKFLDKVPDSNALEVHGYWEHCPKYVRDRVDKRRTRSKLSENVGECRRIVGDNPPLNPRPKTQDPRPEPDPDHDPKKDHMSIQRTEFDARCLQVVNDWNAMAETNGLPHSARLPKKGSNRSKSLMARVKDPEWMDSYTTALSRIPRSAFLTGKTDDNRTWQANLDWFLRPGSVGKILEGQYGCGETHGPPMPHPIRPTDGIL